MQLINADQYNETLDHIRRQMPFKPSVGIILGTGMGALVEHTSVEKELAYNFIPHFPISTVESHFGKLIFGYLGQRPIVAMQGRLHYYEGYSIEQVVYPVRIMKMLGIETLFVSNASGSMNLAIKQGSLMIIEDHINLQPENPLRGPNIDELGPRFPDMSAPYDRQLMDQAHAIAQEENIPLHEGVYVCVQGPNLETRAEYRYLRTIGADVVGMSTVPEIIVANQMGLRCFAMSLITDECDPDNLAPVTLEDILAVARATEPKLTRILSRLIREFE
jgi:purine-nucleoside phosphorylase